MDNMEAELDAFKSVKLRRSNGPPPTGDLTPSIHSRRYCLHKINSEQNHNSDCNTQVICRTIQTIFQWFTSVNVVIVHCIWRKARIFCLANAIHSQMYWNFQVRKVPSCYFCYWCWVNKTTSFNKVKTFWICHICNDNKHYSDTCCNSLLLKPSLYTHALVQCIIINCYAAVKYIHLTHSPA